MDHELVQLITTRMLYLRDDLEDALGDDATLPRYDASLTTIAHHLREILHQVRIDARRPVRGRERVVYLHPIP